MKKILILALAVVMAGTMAACGMGDVGGASSGSASQAASSQAAVSKPSADSFDDNLAGLEKYLAANTVLSGNPTDMEAAFIGAQKGAKYQFDYNGKSNVTVELYEFNTAGLSEQAKKVQDEVKSKGTFTIMNQQVAAELSDSGKYLMIYKDTVTSDQNKARHEEVTKLVKEFKK